MLTDVTQFSSKIKGAYETVGITSLNDLSKSAFWIIAQLVYFFEFMTI